MEVDHGHNRPLYMTWEYTSLHLSWPIYTYKLLAIIFKYFTAYYIQSMLGISRGEHMQNKQDLINKAATKITDFFSSVLLPPVHTAVLHNTGEVSACECASKV